MTPEFTMLLNVVPLVEVDGREWKQRMASTRGVSGRLAAAGGGGGSGGGGGGGRKVKEEEGEVICASDIVLFKKVSYLRVAVL